MTLDDVLNRVLADPIEHLSCRSLCALEGYVVGYNEACRRWGLPHPCEPDRDVVLEWLHEQVRATAEHTSRLNAFNWLNLFPWSHFLATDDRDAFDVYFDLRRRMPHAPSKRFPAPEPSQESIVEILERVSQRPALYFGARFQFVQIWAVCSGFRWAERDNRVPKSLAEPLFTFFPAWLEARYPFSKDIPWHRLFTTLALGYPEDAFGSFLEHFHLYLAGAGPDTEDPTMRAIIEGILAHATKTGGA